jgi:hypothetical protein
VPGTAGRAVPSCRDVVSVVAPTVFGSYHACLSAAFQHSPDGMMRERDGELCLTCPLPLTISTRVERHTLTTTAPSLLHPPSTPPPYHCCICTNTQAHAYTRTHTRPPTHPLNLTHFRPHDCLPSPRSQGRAFPRFPSRLTNSSPLHAVRVNLGPAH